MIQYMVAADQLLCAFGLLTQPKNGRCAYRNYYYKKDLIGNSIFVHENNIMTTHSVTEYLKNSFPSNENIFTSSQ